MSCSRHDVLDGVHQNVEEVHGNNKRVTKLLDSRLSTTNDDSHADGKRRFLFNKTRSILTAVQTERD